ncbi:MAG: nucleotidyltransferase domain-containing protein [Clostridia bacterium]|nr:nucleotidyltransferase domain-containing protein [Clostridia bacterium]
MTINELASLVTENLSTIRGVKGCTLYGSVAAGAHDELSDIDIEIDVSGADNGLFILKLPHMLKKRMPIYYFDYAPSLAPEKYVITMAVDEENPFRTVDVCAAAEPHCVTVTKQRLLECNDMISHTLKLWTANLKHFVRGADCRGDIEKMAKRLDIDATLSSAEILAAVLTWLEENAPEEMMKFIASCRRHFEKVTK